MRLKRPDARRARGDLLGPLDGIPYTAKNSFKVKGMTVAAGSPAFADLIATDDAFAVEKFRASGAILLGLTNMPPMANGGMQRGLYGRAGLPTIPTSSLHLLPDRQMGLARQPLRALQRLDWEKRLGQVGVHLHLTMHYVLTRQVEALFQYEEIGLWSRPWML